VESVPRRKLALVVEYDGTRYNGFQFQVDAPTVQGEIEGALARLTGERIRIVGAGRTDAGVHARGQVVSFDTSSSLAIRSVVAGLNSYLRPDVAVRYAAEVADDFHARRDALSREYRYRIVSGATPSPLEHRYAHFVPGRLDAGSMNEACRVLVGTHDFASFTGPTRRTTEREVHKAEVDRHGELVYFDIAANSFLNKQVRFTVGALIRVGLGRMSAAEFGELMQSRQPSLAAPVAPPNGLCLMKVVYPENKLSEGQLNEDI
jgi:tRNA pseudouridine38-40 synthase